MGLAHTPHEPTPTTSYVVPAFLAYHNLVNDIGYVYYVFIHFGFDFFFLRIRSNIERMTCDPIRRSFATELTIRLLVNQTSNVNFLLVISSTIGALWIDLLEYNWTT